MKMFLGLLWVCAVSAQTWTPTEMMRTKNVTDVVFSPDNQTVLFVASSVDLEKNIYKSQIYRAGAEGASEVFTPSDSSASQPKFSPDGKWVAFISARSGTRQLYVIAANGGEARALTQGKNPVQTYNWSPDSLQIALIMNDRESFENMPIECGKDTALNRLWILDLEGNEPRAVTPQSYYLRGLGDFGNRSEEFDWSPDGKSIVFAYTKASGLENYHMTSSLALLDVASGQIDAWPNVVPFEGLPKFSPDGEWISFVTSGTESTYFYSRYLAIRSRHGGAPKWLAPTYNEGPFLKGTNHLGWSQDGTSVIFLEPKKTGMHLCYLPIDGSAPTEKSIPGRYFEAFSLSPDRSLVGISVQNSSLPPEAYVADAETFQLKQISHLNDPILANPIPQTEVIRWTSTDGQEIEGIVTYPINYEAGKQYPLLLVIHGGPMASFRETFVGLHFVYPTAAFAEQGYIVLCPNPRGSTGYGREFREANRRDWGGMDYQDLMAGVDALIAQGIADPSRMGVMGWSYGGYMTGWVITQTNRFQAASMGAGLSNHLTMLGTCDIPKLMSDYFGEWKAGGLYEERSPLYFADRVNTPCLIQHGTGDLRVPIGQSYEFYRALVRKGKDAVLMIYPDTAHYFEKPKMELLGMEKNLEWFGRYVKGYNGSHE
ncbi:MAG: S9 family peptidase [Verrucomicrobia bacterium]|nr:S9 family peptidase [Verrucomicrobiota bacterium]